MTFQEVMNEYDRRHRASLAMGGPEKLEKRARQGVLNARSRIDYLLDNDSFHEFGQFAEPVLPTETPAPGDGKITGYGRIEGREVAVVSNDFTVKGASSSLSNMRRIAHLRRVAQARGLPIVWLGESSGARLPDNQGARGMGTMLGNDPTQYQRRRETPWASAILGPSYGSSFLYNCCSDFSVMRKGAVMAVSSPGLVELATNQKLTPEELGGWRVHAEKTGLVDVFVDTDEEAIDMIKRFLSYLPSHHKQAPPRVATAPSSPDDSEEILSILPESRTKVYDIKKLINAVIDRDTFLEFKPRFGRALVTGLARMDGRSVGIIANNPFVKGGSMDTDCCDKAIDLLVLCDSFNIPIIFLVDTPGFMIGQDAEFRRAPGKIVNFMNALQLVTVPKLSVILRKSYGQAYLNMGGGRNSDEVTAWPTAEISFMTPAFATTIVHNKRPGDDGFEALHDEMAKDNAVWGAASIFGVQYVIRPQDTRQHLIRLLEVHELRMTNGVGEHLLSNWPTSS